MLEDTKGNASDERPVKAVSVWNEEAKEERYSNCTAPSISSADYRIVHLQLNP